MANRFWVQGSGSWSDTDHWSTESGGSGGASVPTSSDDVFIDTNSGFGSGGTITVSEDEFFVHDFSSTAGSAYTITNDGDEQSICIEGSILLESKLTIDGLYIWLDSDDAETITISGATLDNASLSVLALGSKTSGVYTLQDDLQINGNFGQGNGTFDANDHDITANTFLFFADTGYTSTLIMGNGVWAGKDWQIDEYNEGVFTITAETSTIKLTNCSGGNFVSNGKTYNNVWIHSDVDTFDIVGSNTYNDLRIEPGLAIRFKAGSTQTVTTFTAIGSTGNLITLNSDGVAQFNLSCASGVVSCNYLDLSNSNAAGGAIWYAGSNSEDTTNNDGWIFRSYRPGLASCGVGSGT